VELGHSGTDRRRSDYLGAAFDLPLDPHAARQARRAVADLLQAWHVEDQDVIYDAQVVAIELVTNAVSHGGARIVLEVEKRGDAVLLAVCDGSPELPRHRVADPQDESGRGLTIIGGLAADWGVESLGGGGKRVWALLRPVPDRTYDEATRPRLEPTPRPLEDRRP